MSHTGGTANVLRPSSLLIEEHLHTFGTVPADREGVGLLSAPMELVVGHMAFLAQRGVGHAHQ